MGRANGKANIVSGEIVYVLDTSTLLAGIQLMLEGRMYVTSRVVGEVIDSENRSKLELAISLGKVKVVEPNDHYVRLARRIALRLGEHTSLSDADISVAALALELKDKGYKVIVLTDDYALQNLLKSLGIECKGYRTRGISRVQKYIMKCPGCGYVSKKWGEKICPRCGTQLKKTIATT